MRLSDISLKNPVFAVMVDPQHATFLQAGGELLEGTFMVREAKP
jgi:hypothetical protein